MRQRQRESERERAMGGGGGGGGGGEGGGQVIGTMQVDTGQVVIFIPENNGP